MYGLDTCREFKSCRRQKHKHGDPAGPRRKPGSGYGCGVGIRVDSPLGPLRLEYAFNDQRTGRSRQCFTIEGGAFAMEF
ncbi:hypothetical protein BC332_28286 [Capsicum chinense]|nr:hypothetical protein BC332_28286 [Capsicum chinense]